MISPVNSHLFLYNHKTRPFVAVTFDMEINKSKSTFITVSITPSDRPTNIAFELSAQLESAKGFECEIHQDKLPKRRLFWKRTFFANIRLKLSASVNSEF